MDEHDIQRTENEIREILDKLDCDSEHEWCDDCLTILEAITESLEMRRGELEASG